MQKYQAFDEVLWSIFEKQCCPCGDVAAGTVSRENNPFLVYAKLVSIGVDILYGGSNFLLHNRSLHMWSHSVTGGKDHGITVVSNLLEYPSIWKSIAQEATSSMNVHHGFPASCVLATGFLEYVDGRKARIMVFVFAIIYDLK